MTNIRKPKNFNIILTYNKMPLKNLISMNVMFFKNYNKEGD